MSRPGVVGGTVAAVVPLAVSGCGGHTPERPRIITRLKAVSHQDGLVWERGVVRVPLDHSGHRSGHIDRAVELLHKPGPRRPLAIGLAGGPGQAAIPFRERFVNVLRPVLGTHDLLVFDQRGTGSSGPLRCPKARAAGGPLRYPPACAREVGDIRRFYSSDDSAADIHALNSLLGRGKAILLAASYGTFVALDYARLYPNDVNRLVLDSVETGQNQYDQYTLRSALRVMHALCTDTRCPPPLDKPWDDLEGLIEELKQEGESVLPYNWRGALVPLQLDEAKLTRVLVEGDIVLALLDRAAPGTVGTCPNSSLVPCCATSVKRRRPCGSRPTDPARSRCSITPPARSRSKTITTRSSGSGV